MTNRQIIENSITVLEAKRHILGDDVVDASSTALRQELAEIEEREVAQSALRGERKQVTVMFADISGFTAMSEKLDPEEVRSMINACFERLGVVIDRYEGHIDKFIGDEIMALFGAPIAHENDPERALRAALDMMATLAEFNAEHVARIPKPLALHFGINTGLVIAGGIGTSQRQDYSVMGDTVNLASRLEGLSEAGEILVGENTYRLTAPLFEFEALKPVKVKGKENPILVYQVLRARTAAGQVRGIDGLTSPLVGRQAEMDILETALDQAHQGQGGVISIIGEAGIGKSRLIVEAHLNRRFDGRVRWAEGRSVSYGENASYLVTRRLFCDLLGLEPEARPAEIGTALQAEIKRLFPEQPGDIYPFLGHLLEVPLSADEAQPVKYLEGDALHRQISESTRRFLSASAVDQPLILVWEDLHWVDPSSLALLETLLPLTQSSPVLLLLAYRPRREKRIWAFHEKAHQLLGTALTCIELMPLTLDESHQLLDNLLGGGDLGARTVELILNKAEGNPFYIEEVIRSLIDHDMLRRTDDDQGWIVVGNVENVEIPDTLQGVIMSRIDRLNPEMKHLLQIASVIGRNFPYRVLDRIVNKN
jgi:class 3 adenylate cyclase